jgi:hypothetical protein
MGGVQMEQENTNNHCKATIDFPKNLRCELTEGYKGMHKAQYSEEYCDKMGMAYGASGFCWNDKLSEYYKQADKQNKR